MLEVKVVKRNVESIKGAYKKRNMSQEDIDILDHIIRLDDKRSQLQTEMDSLLAQRNSISAEIGDLFKSGQKELANAKKSDVAKINEETEGLDRESRSVKNELEDLLLQLPNIPHDSVPFGNTEADNIETKAWDKPLPTLHDNALPHWDLATKYDLFSLALGAKVAGAGFVVYKGKGAALQRALISFFLAEAIKAGYTEYMPPLLVNEDTARGTGQLPDKEGQMYHVTKDDLYLIPTAEVPLTNIYRDTIVDVSELPIKITGFTSCFRREAGSYGAHVKGLNRLHQFEKIEIVQITEPEKSYDTIKEMVDHVAQVLDKLGLPYRIVQLCGGDLGHAAAITYDFEVYSAAQGRWLEVSSVSNFETYQTNRMKLRYRKDKKNKLAHTLNGSALALARIVAAVLENFQDENGIRIPEALLPFTGFDRIE